MRDEIDFSGKWIEIESVEHFKYIVEVSGASEPPDSWGSCVDELSDYLKGGRCFIEFTIAFKDDISQWCWGGAEPEYGEEIKIEMPMEDEMRELYGLEVGTCFEIEGKEHLEYIKSLMGDKFRFYGDCEDRCLFNEPYLNVFNDFELASADNLDIDFEQVSMPIPEGWMEDKKTDKSKITPTAKKPKLLVIGSGRHGKDFFCETLSKQFGFTFKSSSEFMAKKIFPLMKGVLGYKTEQECFEDRHNHRGLWYELIGAFNHKDKAYLTKELLSEYDIYCGMRSKAELDECKEQGLFDLIIWVDASERVDYEESADSISITKEDADIVILNNGTQEDLLDKIDKLMFSMGVKYV